MAKPKDQRICRLHELAVRDADGYTRMFQYGEIVTMTPALEEALGEFVTAFEPVPAAKSAGSSAPQAQE